MIDNPEKKYAWETIISNYLENKPKKEFTKKEKLGIGLKELGINLSNTLKNIGLNIPFDVLRTFGANIPVTQFSPTMASGKTDEELYNYKTSEFAPELLKNSALAGMTYAGGKGVATGLAHNPLGLIGGVIGGASVGEGVNREYKRKGYSGWGDYVNQKIGLDKDVADWTNPGYIVGGYYGSKFGRGLQQAGSSFMRGFNNAKSKPIDINYEIVQSRIAQNTKVNPDLYFKEDPYGRIVNNAQYRKNYNRNLNDLNTAYNDYFPQYDKKVINLTKPDRIRLGVDKTSDINMLAHSNRATDKTIKRLIKQDNTFIRGVSQNKNSPTSPELFKELNKLGIDPNDTQKVAEYKMTHVPIFNTGGGRAHTDNFLDNNLDALYTSNSHTTGEGYTYGDGYWGLVRRPLNFKGSRKEWLDNNKVNYITNDDLTQDPNLMNTLKGQPQILKTDYSPETIQEMIDSRPHELSRFLKNSHPELDVEFNQTLSNIKNKSFIERLNTIKGITQDLVNSMPDKLELVQWIGDHPTVRPRLGQEFRFTTGASGDIVKPQYYYNGPTLSNPFPEGSTKNIYMPKSELLMNYSKQGLTNYNMMMFNIDIARRLIRNGFVPKLSKNYRLDPLKIKEYKKQTELNSAIDNYLTKVESINQSSENRELQEVKEFTNSIIKKANIKTNKLNDPYAHYIFLDKPGTKILEPLKTYKVSPDKWFHKSRGHYGSYSPLATMAGLGALALPNIKTNKDD